MPIFENKKCAQFLLNNINYYQKKYCFWIFASAVLPGRWDVLIQVGKGTKVSKIMQLIKYRTASDIRKNDCGGSLAVGFEDDKTRFLDESLAVGFQLPAKRQDRRRCENSIWRQSFNYQIVCTHHLFAKALNAIQASWRNNNLPLQYSQYPYLILDKELITGFLC